MHSLRRVLVRVETRKVRIQKAIAEAEDCIQDSWNTRRAWREDSWTSEAGKNPTQFTCFARNKGQILGTEEA